MKSAHRSAFAKDEIVISGQWQLFIYVLPSEAGIPA